MGSIVVLGVFVADTTFRAERMARIGETILGKSFSLGPGGKGSNQAVAAARMGGDVSILTKLGQDDFAEMALQLWADAGVTPHVEQLADSYTGAANIFIEDASGDNAIIVAPGAGATISAPDMDRAGDIIRAASVFMTQLEQPMAAAMRALEIAKEAGVTTILNPAPSATLLKGMLALCDYVTPNETEACDLTGVGVASIEQAAQASVILQDQGVAAPIITLGERGAYLHGHGLVPAVNAGPVVETTGAGDAFNGAFASELAAGRDPVQAVRFGCAAAGISVTRPGAAASMPMRAEVEALMGS